MNRLPPHLSWLLPGRCSISLSLAVGSRNAFCGQVLGFILLFTQASWQFTKILTGYWPITKTWVLGTTGLHLLGKCSQLRKFRGDCWKKKAGLFIWHFTAGMISWNRRNYLSLPIGIGGQVDLTSFEIISIFRGFMINHEVIQLIKPHLSWAILHIATSS